MRSAKHIVEITKPCTQNWDEMTPVERGRFCASCQKTVVDLSCSTDQEVIDFFKKAAGTNPCAKFHSSQLGRELVEVRQPSFLFALLKKMAASLLFFQAIVTTAWAQKAKAPTAQHAKKKTIPEDRNKRIIRGKVLDQATNQQLAGMVVNIAGTEINSTTDNSGSFRIMLPDSFIAQKMILKVGYVNGAKPGGTAFLDEEIATDTAISGKEIIIYRYPEEFLPRVTIVEYKPELITHTTLGGPIYRHEIKKIPYRRYVWHRATSIFRKKKKASNE